MTTPREEEIARIDALLSEEGDIEEVLVEEAETEDQEGEEEKVVAPELDKVEEPKIEPVKLEVSTTAHPESAVYFKLREEARKREAAEAELAELKRPKIAKEENYEGYIESEIGTTKQDLAELKAWKAEQEAKKRDEEDREGAFRELHGYEQEAAQAFPDFNEAANYAKSMIAASIKLLNPTISQQDLAEKTLNEYAKQAALALNNKKHPGQAIYENAAAWGYKKTEAEKPKIVLPEKTQLATLAINKKKSTGMSGAGGSGKSDIGNDELMKMSNADRMRLSPSDWARLEQEA